MANHFDRSTRWLAGMAAIAFCAAAAFMVMGRLRVSAQTQVETRPPARFFGASPVAPAAQPPVRPRASYAQEAEQPAPRPRAIKGLVRLDSVDRAFKGAVLVITLERAVGGKYDVPAEKVAELRFFNVSKRADSQTYVPFIFGDFSPRPNAYYTLQCYLDLNGNGVLSAGDYWNQRRVDVLTPEDPEVVRIEDFAMVAEVAK